MCIYNLISSSYEQMHLDVRLKRDSYSIDQLRP